jgi:molybdate transport system ATP-binding protein
MASGGEAGLVVRVRKALAGGFVLDARLTAAPGFTVLFGPSGAGKTTLLNCIAGLTAPEDGEIVVNGRVLFDAQRGVNVPGRERRIGYVFQDLALFPHLTAGENIAYGLWRLPAAERRARAQAALESFRIAHLERRKPRQISGGERQRVALARALVTDPCALLLDEPLAGLDLPTRSRLLEDLRAWNARRRLAVLYVTHSREEVFALGDRVIAIERGSVLAEGSPYEILEAPRSEAVAAQAGIENRFDAVVVALNESKGTMTCRLAEQDLTAEDAEERRGFLFNSSSASFAPSAVRGTAIQVELEAPLGRAEPGDQVRVGVRAGDILVAAAPPRGLSARNILRGRLHSISRRDATVVAVVDCGVRFEVHLTPGAQEELDLHPGREVWLVIKTHSCRLLVATSY